MALSTKRANVECMSRPKDERFTSIAGLLASALADVKACTTVNVLLTKLRAIVLNGTIAVQNSETGKSGILTPWSFGQLARYAGAPAGYLQTLSPDLAVENLNYGLARNAGLVTDPLQVYVRRAPIVHEGTDKPIATIRAFTSQDYTRLNDATVIAGLQRLQTVRPGLDLPPTWDKANGEDRYLKGGAYRGDRDQFVIMVDGGSIVEDRTIGFGGSNGTMYRGIICRNSEVGAAKIEILTFLFRGICGNHCIWGVSDKVRTASRHVGDVGDRFRQMVDSATSFFDRPASEDEDRIVQLNAIELGSDREEVVSAGRSLGLTLEQAENAYTSAETFEPNPRSVWGYAQGITRISQDEVYADDRFSLDLVAAKLLRQRIAAL